nr:AAA family ATPase [Campylobacter sp.]
MGIKIYFISGIYGVGKTTLIQTMSKTYFYESFSASDIISNCNGENYEFNKQVTNKYLNQDILVNVVNNKLLPNAKNNILLAGHFCIIGNTAPIGIEKLPMYVYENLNINKIVVLTANPHRILQNLAKRNKQTHYDEKFISLFQDTEVKFATTIAKKLGVDCLVYNMQYNNNDIINIRNFLER